MLTAGRGITYEICILTARCGDTGPRHWGHGRVWRHGPGCGGRTAGCGDTGLAVRWHGRAWCHGPGLWGHGRLWRDGPRWCTQKRLTQSAGLSTHYMGMERRSVVKAALLLSLSGVRARRGMDSRIPFTAVCTSGLFAAWYSQSRHRRSSSLSDLVWAPIFDDTVELSSVASRRCRPFTLVDRD